MKFDTFAAKVTKYTGSSKAFMLALTLIVVWLISGPFFHFSDVWQLVINTATTIITFLMVFLIQNSQNKDTKALHLKIDGLIHGTKTVDNSLGGIENKTTEELENLEKQKQNG